VKKKRKNTTASFL
ncbi:alpha-1,2-fucosyltransferase, partial [Helicobacter pylori]